MKSISWITKVMTFSLMLVTIVPLASETMTTASAAIHDELEDKKMQLRAELERCMAHLEELLWLLQEKATEDEVPELYNQVMELKAMTAYTAEGIERATTEEELADVEMRIQDIRVKLDELYWKIENLFDFTADTVDGIKMMFKIISEEDKTVEVTGIGSHEANCTLTIPGTVKGYTVISIREQAFEDSDIGAVIIPNTMKSISSHAFYDCWKLTSVTIPNSVTSIDGQAFYRCISLTSVDIPNSVTYIGIQAFWQCTSLTSIVIPNSVTSIESSAFSGCSNLTSVNIPSSVTFISSYAFNGTRWYNNQSDGLLYLDNWLLGYKGDQLTGELTIAEGTKGIAGSAFYRCNGLTSISIPNSVTYINEYAFSECTGLTSVNISNLEVWCNISFASNPLEYAHHLYLNGEEIMDLVIPTSVTSISSLAFSGCTYLNSVTIPNSVTTIGHRAFQNCSNLSSVTALMEEPFAINSNTFYSGTYTSATLYVPQDTRVKYWLTGGWKLFNEVVEINASYSYDVNGDGEVNSADITCLANKILGISVSGVELSYTSCPDDHHPHLIDLGLPSCTKWACCNIGASKPEEHGGYYAWGETEEKDVYNWNTYIHYVPSSYTNIQENDIASTEYDAATANWGASWRMPSLEQITELTRYCSSVWTTQNGVNGRVFTGPNGATLFLPAAGLIRDSELYDVGSCGLYRSSTHDMSNAYYAYELYFDSSGMWSSIFNGYLCNGFPVRSVQIDKAYDVNQDGKINIADVTFLVNKITYLERLNTLETP